ncbi:AAA family ATPase [Clostridium tyrobutyricum]|uniref:AAA family ATPase n=1 Tax=Clostridium tyrobutyricum TaxID=1519 RepID=UPI001C3845A6|nr:AAA family ATPase [Clostridium tyrobutyricum]
MKNYSLKHISLRVPWHDSEWNGSVCSNPKNNLSCLRVKNIALSKDEVMEQKIKSCPFNDLKENEVPPCLEERGCFMSDTDYVKNKVHPYASNGNKMYKHFLPTKFKYKKYSAVGVPYRWMLKDNMDYFKKNYDLDIDINKEPDLEFNTNWVQARDNQKELLDCFFGYIKPKKSICIFYAKEVPFIEDSRRVIVGVGRVNDVGSLVEYEYSSDKEPKSILWERNIEHSIRSNFSDGFLMPYREVIGFANKNTKMPIKDMIAFTPDDKFEEYSYATEHLSDDTVIESLLNCLKTFKNIEKNIKINCKLQIKWINSALEEVWRYRGAYPGIGPVLTAMGVQMGNFIAKDIEDKLQDNEDPWNYLNEVFINPGKYLSDELCTYITGTLQELWKLMPSKRKKFLKLLSRFAINTDQVNMFIDSSNRLKYKIDCSDNEIVSNPYRIFELSIETEFPIGIGVIDRGIFPLNAIAAKFPLNRPSKLEDGNDKRRIRALIVEVLEKAGREGHTLLPIDDVRRRLEKLSLSPQCVINEDFLRVAESYFENEINIIDLKSGVKAYQLKKFYRMESLIRNIIEQRIKSKKYSINSDWNKIMDKTFGMLENIKNQKQKDYEMKARKEKIKALKIISENKVSALVGPAGTGKTSVINIFLSVDEMKGEEILLLAPTGKARVRLEEVNKNLKITAYTIAQFLSKSNRFDWKIFKYKILGKTEEKKYGTVIIDEASMLTIDMMAALFECIKKSKRIILVGDIRQLPPIGAGRPFVDIVNYFKKQHEINHTDLISELFVLNRQRQMGGVQREDSMLAKWFSGEIIHPAEDDIFDLVQLNNNSQYLEFVSWKNEEDFYRKMESIMIKELELKDMNDVDKFNKSLGADEKVKGKLYFNLGAAEKIEDWQILSPVRNPIFGCNTINHWIHKNFRNKTVKYSLQRFSKISKPLGMEQIVCGDKVINVLNHRRKGYPSDKSKNYIANGEIGIVVDASKSKNYSNVEFSTQIGYEYGFKSANFSEENDDVPLELAYCITVHKSQGSQFNKVILVIPKNCRTLSRELLYTALTRQKEKVIILYQGSIHELREYSLDEYSETAKRLTNLFIVPNPQYNTEVGTFLDINLIHQNSVGDVFRSKSELIISERLILNDIEYNYEKPLKLNECTKYPDFTIENDYGDIFYWEHCGLMNDKDYKQRWNKKLQLYKQNGIKPLNEGGNLIITVEDGTNGINIKHIDNIITKIK